MLSYTFEKCKLIMIREKKIDNFHQKDTAIAEHLISFFRYKTFCQNVSISTEKFSELLVLLFMCLLKLSPVFSQGIDDPVVDSSGKGRTNISYSYDFFFFLNLDQFGMHNCYILWKNCKYWYI